MCEVVKGTADNVAAKVAALRGENRELEKEIARLKQKLASSAGSDLTAAVVEVQGIKVLAANVEGADAKSLRDTLDQCKNKLGSAVILLAAVTGDKITLTAGVTKDLTDRVKAGDLMREFAERLGGKGGGKPDMAQGGGTDVRGLARRTEDRARVGRVAARLREAGAISVPTLFKTWPLCCLIAPFRGRPARARQVRPQRTSAGCAIIMSLFVQKFGGTSVGDLERIGQVADKVAGFRAAGHDLVVVVSAMSGETNRLIAMANEVQERPLPRELDVLLSTGEQVTTALLSMALNERGVKAKSYTGTQVRILTDDAHTKARIREIDDERLHRDLKDGYVIVVAGFQGVDENGNITTLGRGGSDTTAVALAAALKADECQIYTDVDGVYTTDPRVVDGARRLSKITFEEMLEMASMGSKVLQIRSVEFAGKYNVPLRVLHSFKDGPGTLITMEDDSEMEVPTIAGIAFNRDEAKLTIEGVPDIPGVAYRILGPIGEANIEVDVIVQNVSHDKTADFTFTVGRNDLLRAEEVLNKVAKEIKAETRHQRQQDCQGVGGGRGHAFPRGRRQPDVCLPR